MKHYHLSLGAGDLYSTYSAGRLLGGISAIKIVSKAVQKSIFR